MKIQVRDINYKVRSSEPEAKGPTLILLHGFLGSGRSFDHLISHLKQASNIITIDLLGHGGTEGALTSTRYSTEEQLRDLNILLQKLSIDKPVLYGYSMGGRLALRYALNHQNRLKGLILESTHPGIKSEKNRQQRHQKDQQWAEQISSEYQSFLNWWHQLDLFNSPTSTLGSRINHYKQIQYNQRPDQMAFSLEGFGQGAVTPVHHKLSSLTIPTLLGAGKDDPKYVRRMKNMYTQMANADLFIIDGAAHRLHLDQPAQWSKPVKNFILDLDLH